MGSWTICWTGFRQYFLHCHKSYLINLNYVRQLEMYRIRLEGEEEWIPVSQKYYKHIKTAFLQKRNSKNDGSALDFAKSPI